MSALSAAQQKQASNAQPSQPSIQQQQKPTAAPPHSFANQTHSQSAANLLPVSSSSSTSSSSSANGAGAAPASHHHHHHQSGALNAATNETSSSVSPGASSQTETLNGTGSNGTAHQKTTQIGQNGSSTSNLVTSNNGNMSGYLFKWTNYLKGYQKRWIFLNNGFLSYYRSPNEMDHTCRGAINLANAHIQQNDDGVSFVVSNGGNQTFHLRASNDQERQRWISALEAAKNKAPRPYHHTSQQNSSYFNGITGGANSSGGSRAGGGPGNDDMSDDDENGNSMENERTELENFLQVLQHKLNELSLSHEFVLKHSNMLSKSLTELENIQARPDETAIKTINERSTIYKVAMNGVLNNCQEFINLAQFHTRKMHKILQSEHEIRLRLEDMVQEMAKQHLNIETQLSKRGKGILGRGNTNADSKASGGLHKHHHHHNQSNQSTAASVSGTVGGLPKATTTGQQQQQQQTQSSTPVGDKQSQHQQTSQLRSTDQADSLSSIAATTSTSAGGDGDDDDTYLTNDNDEFHDAVEDVTQFSVTLPRTAKGLHQRNPSNISKIYLQESDDDDEYDNSENDDEDGERKRTIKVTMHSATSQDAAESTKTSSSSSAHTNSQANASNALVKKKTSNMDLTTLKSQQNRPPPRQRRTQITPRPNYSINLWSIMKNCIGKDLSKIPIPVNFSEPLSMLQRITEELEYSQLLDQAAECEDQWEQMALVAAFTVTSYSTTATRTNKPFNPMLGETFEFDRLDDLGWRSVAEQVSHHPPGFAFHVESVKDWTFYQEFNMSSKFRGQYLQVVPLGTSHLEFKKTGNHYTWRKVSTFVRNIIVGKLWIDNVGEMDIINHKTKDVCHLKYFAYSYFSREPPRKVTGIITDANNVARYVLNGTWTEQIEGAPVLNPQVVTQHTQLNTGKSKILWKRKYPPPFLEPMYYFTEFAVQLNEPEQGVAPTDSRLRPDQRFMEEGRWDEANQEKLRLEEKQRTARKAREAAAADIAAAAPSYPNSIDSKNPSSSTPTADNDDDDDIDKMMRLQASNAHKSSDPEPAWFKRTIDPFTNLPIHVFKNEYWDCKAKQDWSRCPDLF